MSSLLENAKDVAKDLEAKALEINNENQNTLPDF